MINSYLVGFHGKTRQFFIVVGTLSENIDLLLCYDVHTEIDDENGTIGPDILNPLNYYKMNGINKEFVDSIAKKINSGETKLFDIGTFPLLSNQFENIDRLVFEHAAKNVAQYFNYFTYDEELKYCDFSSLEQKFDNWMDWCNQKEVNVTHIKLSKTQSVKVVKPPPKVRNFEFL